VAIPSTLNDTRVVPIDVDVGFGTSGRDECVNKKFKANSLGPANVSLLRLPITNETPCLPVGANNHPDTNARACIKVICDVEDL
jgi:hypothetical protein